jgi:hypothetical protein
MTDLSTPAPVFVVPLVTEQVQTTMFGIVTISEISSRRLNALLEEHPPERDGRLFAWGLLCEAARGEHGERFTMQLLDDLPNRALADLSLLMKTAVQVNAVNQESVEKP